MPDWAAIYREFRPAYARTYRRAILTALGFALACAAGGLVMYLKVDDALVPAVILWLAAGAAAGLPARHPWVSSAKKPWGLAGRVIKKRAVVRADSHRSKFTKPVLALQVTEAFELTPAGRGADLPQKTGALALVVSRYLFSRIAADQAVTLVCLPSGEAMGMIHQDRLAMEDRIDAG